ncbi:uncharacterized protein F4812DRAFT_416202 [Daldinia caldariorum]|uniref:uncharacterized protein n=1 Tax=Daldinia caldariorum TaxID=326644 RepID=UPI0020081DB1|nr:uncharacterized protein F4812DRAFT_416202 [Daldinia caldariorum]KAI1471965.1 hypothetical protein F4812DRAFT_416202 [Daldinia caldariorum]
MRFLANVPIFHGTTSHPDSPHPTQAEVQIDQAISSSTGAGQARRHSASSSKMLLSDLYKSTKSPLSRLRHHSRSPPAPLDYDPDLVSRDKTKQKEAIKRVLAAKVRNDWNFEWRPVTAKPNPETGGTEAARTTEGHDDDDVVVEDIDSGDDAASVYSTVSEDLTHFRPRSEWLSDMPDDEDDDDDDVAVSPSTAYRFDNPDAVGTLVKVAALAKSAKRRRAVRSEMEWNEGLACFNARRDAWTGAKAARIRPKATTPVVTSPASKRLSWWHISTSPSPSSPTESIGAGTTLSRSATRTSGDTTAVSSSDAEFRETRTREDSSTYPVETLIPIPQPILPVATPMRASITAAAYPTIYDKIVVQSATPSCPVNLGDVVRACVAGWKRDGEWPPRGTDPPAVVAVRKKTNGAESRNNAPRRNASKRMSFSFLGRRQADPSNPAENTSHPEKDDGSHATGKAFKKSLQKVLGLGHERTASTASNQG